MLRHLLRHFEVAGEALAQDREAAKTRPVRSQTDFLPAALEILETPPNPLGRTILWLLMAFLSIAIAWSFLGRVDVVASAQGKIIPEGRVKIIQPVELGVVRAIYAREGLNVEAGDPLIELDPTVSGAELEQARQALLAARIDRARAQALVDFAAGKPALFQAPDGAPAGLVAMQETLVAARVREHQTARAALREELAQRRADASMVASEALKLARQLPLAKEQLAGLEQLRDQGFAPKVRVMEVQERVIGLEQDLAIRTEERVKTEAAIAGVQQQLGKLDSEFARTALDALTEAEANVRLRTEEAKKARERSENTILTAPIAGTVQQLAVTTLGGVVKPADPLLVIVPRTGDCPAAVKTCLGDRLIVEAMASNKDAGFLALGQPVEVKLEAYPFTRYGIVPGILVAVSQDAIEKNNGDLIFPMRVQLERDHIMVNGEKRALAPGLAVTAEIKTGRRRIIDFLLSPLARRVEEAGRER